MTVMKIENEVRYLRLYNEVLACSKNCMHSNWYV